MKQSDLTPITLVPILMATFSLVSMIVLLQIDKIVHGTLYSYGLVFNNAWAQPYWQMNALIFAMGWSNIIAALAFQFYVVTFERRQARRFADAVRDEVTRTRIQVVEMFREIQQEDTVPCAAPTPEVEQEETTETRTATQQNSSEEAPAPTPTDQQAEQTEQSEEQEAQPQHEESQPEPPQPEQQQDETKPETTEKKEETPIIAGIPADELNASQ